jgi:hypothetical protein
MSEEQQRNNTMGSACKVITNTLFNEDDKKWKEDLCNALKIPLTNVSPEVGKQLSAVKASLQAIAKSSAGTSAPAVEAQKIAGEALLICVPQSLEILNSMAVVEPVSTNPAHPLRMFR